MTRLDAQTVVASVTQSTQCQLQAHSSGRAETLVIDPSGGMALGCFAAAIGSLQVRRGMRGSSRCEPKTGRDSVTAHQVDINDEAVKVEEDFSGPGRLGWSMRGRHDEKERYLGAGFIGDRCAVFGKAGPSTNKGRGFHFTAPAGFPNNIADLSFVRRYRTLESCECRACTPQNAPWCRARRARI